METIKKENYRGYTIRVGYDETPENPREFYDNTAVFCCKYRNYMLGDRQDPDECADELFKKYVLDTNPRRVVDEWMKNRDANVVTGRPYGRSLMYIDKTGGESRTVSVPYPFTMKVADMAQELADDMETWEKLELVRRYAPVELCPISVYDHGGISISLGGKRTDSYGAWDSSDVGFAYVERDEAVKNGHAKDWRQWARKIMEVEMEVYSKYVSGEIYIYEAEMGSLFDGEDSMCVGGYYDVESALEDAKMDIDSSLARRKERHQSLLAKAKEALANLSGTTFTNGKIVVCVDCAGPSPELMRATIKGTRVGEFKRTTLCRVPDSILAEMAE